MMLDMIGGVLLLAAASSLLVTAIVRQGRVAARLAEDRAAVRRAETVLAALADVGTAAAPPPADATVRTLPDAAAAGWRWVTVDVPNGSRRVELTGLVRAVANGEAR